MVKRLRHRPFTAVTRVRFPSGSPYGGLAQPVERLLHTQEVTDSSSVVSTIFRPETTVSGRNFYFPALYCAVKSPHGRKSRRRTAAKLPERTHLPGQRDRERILRHRATILEAAFSQLNGDPTYTVEQVRPCCGRWINRLPRRPGSSRKIPDFARAPDMARCTSRILRQNSQIIHLPPLASDRVLV